MAYDTGSATDTIDLVNKFATFVEANGWTRDSLANEASGRRYHAHNGSQYVNMRGYLNETPSSSLMEDNGTGFQNPPAGCYSVALNIGTAYNGANPWFQQTGAATRSGEYTTVGISLLTASMTYHFFTQNSGDQVFAVVEYASGKYQWFGFGVMEKYGSWTGGEFMFGSTRGVGATISSRIGGPYKYHQTSTRATIMQDNSGIPSHATVDVDSETGWHEALSGDNSTPSARRLIDINSRVHAALDNTSPNSVNAVAPFMPYKIYVSRSAASGMASGAGLGFTPLGEIPGFYSCWIENFVPAQQVTLGSDDYRVFPWCGKGATETDFNTSTRLSAFYGFAIKE